MCDPPHIPQECAGSCAPGPQLCTTALPVPTRAAGRNNRNAEGEVTDALIISIFLTAGFYLKLVWKPALGAVTLLRVQEGWDGPRVLSLLLGCLVLPEPLGWCSPVVVLCPGSPASAGSAAPCSATVLFVFQTWDE